MATSTVRSSASTNYYISGISDDEITNKDDAAGAVNRHHQFLLVPLSTYSIIHSQQPPVQSVLSHIDCLSVKSWNLRLLRTVSSHVIQGRTSWQSPPILWWGCSYYSLSISNVVLSCNMANQGDTRLRLLRWKVIDGSREELQYREQIGILCHYHSCRFCSKRRLIRGTGNKLAMIVSGDCWCLLCFWYWLSWVDWKSLFVWCYWLLVVIDWNQSVWWFKE